MMTAPRLLIIVLYNQAIFELPYIDGYVGMMDTWE